MLTLADLARLQALHQQREDVRVELTPLAMRVYRLTNADCDAMRAVLTQAAQAGAPRANG